MATITHKKHHGEQVQVFADGRRVAYASPGDPINYIADAKLIPEELRGEVRAYLETHFKKPSKRDTFAPAVPEALLEQLKAQEAEVEEDNE